MADSRPAELEALLRRDGPLTALELGSALGLSQPTVSRALAGSGDRIVRIGRARASRYALGRDIARAGNRWLLHRIAPDGRPETLGELRAVHPRSFHFQPALSLPAFRHAPFADGRYPDLPWFLDDQRPQGFLGRAFAHRVAADIGAPDDLARWQPEDIVLALLRHGEDAPGDLVLGDAALERALHTALSPEAMSIAQRESRYPQLADGAMSGEEVGSSAGGEQPKFTACLEEASGHRAVIVKFSERAGTPAAQRWADLLHCEHIAGSVLRAHGVPAADTELLHFDGRTFLQSARFDRTAALGRRGLVSLAALDAAYYGHGRIDWWRLASELLRDGWVDANDARTLAILGWFGALTGNSDMHLGNASLVLADARPLALAPSYDMLPMALRPASSGEVVERILDMPPPLPGQQAHWLAAARAARDFWSRVASESNISPPFRDIAANQRDRLEAAIIRFG